MPLQLLCHFDRHAAAQPWRAIDDRVMGGVSRSALRFDPAGHAVFEGEVSLAQGGGFASVRATVERPGDIGAQQICIDALGDGHHYTLSLFMDAAVDAPAYQATFTPTVDGWQKLHVPLDSFVARFRGRAVAGAPPLQAGRICQLGLLISARQAGSFALAVRSIALC